MPTWIFLFSNTIIRRFYPPKNLHRYCFIFPLGHLYVPGEIANNNYAKFWGVKEVYLFMGLVQVENQGSEKKTCATL